MRQTTTWTAQAAVDRDVVNLFVVRYSWPETTRFPLKAQRPVRLEHLTPYGWQGHGEGYVIQPALSLPGWLLSELKHTRHFYPTLAEQQVMDLLDAVLKRA